MGRIEYLCSLIDPCASFADVGCDHGYCSLHVLRAGKCKDVIISDVSAKCLQKAEKLLSDFIVRGWCRAVRCDGLREIPENTEQILVAGMGGEEIIKILSEAFLPRKFIFQPMKNAEKLRAYLIERGCKITLDDIFKDGKFYFVIKGERGGGTAPYSETELQLGRDALKNPLIKDYAREELLKKERYLTQCGESYQREKILEQIKILTEIMQ